MALTNGVQAPATNNPQADAASQYSIDQAGKQAWADAINNAKLAAAKSAQDLAKKQ
jgi:hypothetical protein